MPTSKLWTPIASAFEAYRRRAVMEPAAEYEHIWRLIHIQEALAVTLASLLAARVAHLSSNGSADAAQRMNDLREALTGLRQAQGGEDDEDDIEPSPWGGSIGAWIDVLRRFGKSAIDAKDPFLAPVAVYLSSSPQRGLAFADAWARIAPVPDTFRDAGLDRLGRMGAINSFRNKLAHVPVPQRLLAELHRGLRIEVLDGLTEEFKSEVHANSLGFVSTKFRPPLTGVLYQGKKYVTGANDVGIDEGREPASETRLEASYGGVRDAVSWGVQPFFRIDNEAKPALLFRVSDLHREPGATGYGGEYHRFAAELEPVTYVAIPADLVRPWIPRADGPDGLQSDVAPEVPTSPPTGVDAGQQPGFVEHHETKPSSTDLRQRAEDAFSRRSYAEAATLFDDLARDNRFAVYNDVARSKHGAALWRAAETLPHLAQRVEQLNRAIELLRSAERHRDSRYSSRAAYEGSKAQWHLWRETRDGKALEEALASAERAIAGAPEEAFISWHARVKADSAYLPENTLQASDLPGDPGGTGA